MVIRNLARMLRRDRNRPVENPKRCTLKLKRRQQSVRKGCISMSDIAIPGLGNLSPIKPPHSGSDPIKSNFAEEYVKRIITVMNDYNSRLDHSQQVALSLVHFGQNMTINVSSIGFWNPGLVIYRGTAPDGTPIELVQHVSQISCLLTSVPRTDTSTPKRPIGFAVDHEAAATSESPT